MESGATVDYDSPNIFASIGEGFYLSTKDPNVTVLSPGGSSPFGIRLAGEHQDSVDLSEQGYQELNELLNQLAKKLILSKHSGTLDVLANSVGVTLDKADYTDSDTGLEIVGSTTGITFYLATPGGFSLMVLPNMLAIKDVDGQIHEFNTTKVANEIKALSDAATEETRSWISSRGINRCGGNWHNPLNDDQPRESGKPYHNPFNDDQPNEPDPCEPWHNPLND